MLIWRGKGILVVAIVLVAFMVSIPLASAFIKAFGMPQTHVPRIGIPITLLFAAAGNFFFARYLDDPAKHRTLVDPSTGQAFLFRDRSSLMFIPVRIWTYIFGVLGVLALLAAILGTTIPAPPPTRAGALQTPQFDVALAAPRRPV